MDRQIECFTYQDARASYLQKTVTYCAQSVYRSAIRKITVYDVIYEKNISAQVRLIHAEQMSLYNFIILKAII